MTRSFDKVWRFVGQRAGGLRSERCLSPNRGLRAHWRGSFRRHRDSELDRLQRRRGGVVPHPRHRPDPAALGVGQPAQSRGEPTPAGSSISSIERGCRAPSSRWAGWRSATRIWFARSPGAATRSPPTAHEHKLAYRIGRSAFREDTMRSKSILEDLIGEEVVGFRAAGFSITEDTPWAFEELVSLGFRYDSSVFPARRGHGGLRGAPSVPHRICSGGSESLIEFPIAPLEAGPFRFPFSGGGYLRLYPVPVIRWCLERLLGSGDRRQHLHPPPRGGSEPPAASPSAVSPLQDLREHRAIRGEGRRPPARLPGSQLPASRRRGCEIWKRTAASRRSSSSRGVRRPSSLDFPPRGIGSQGYLRVTSQGRGEVVSRGIHVDPATTLPSTLLARVPRDPFGVEIAKPNSAASMSSNT